MGNFSRCPSVKYLGFFLSIAFREGPIMKSGSNQGSEEVVLVTDLEVLLKVQESCPSINFYRAPRKINKALDSGVISFMIG